MEALPAVDLVVVDSLVALTPGIRSDRTKSSQRTCGGSRNWRATATCPY